MRTTYFYLGALASEDWAAKNVFGGLGVMVVKVDAIGLQ